jgi:signal transduction histidine kinase
MSGVAGLCAWMALAAAGRARGQIETRVRNVAEYLSETCRFPLGPVILEQVKSLSGADYLLVTADGKVASTLGEPPTTAAGGAACDDWRSLRLGPVVRVDERAYLSGAIRLWREPNAGSTLHIFYPEDLWRDAVREAVWPVLLVGGCVGFGSLVLAVGLGRHLSGRLGDLERRTRLIAAGDFSSMPLPRRNDEIRDLTRSINDMAARLGQLQEAVRRAERLRLLGQVAGGLAHQLRNGLTGARLAVQLFLRESAPGTDAAALDVALRQLTLLETRLTRFLELGGQEEHNPQPCSLVALVDEAVHLLGPQCRHAGTELRWHRPPHDLSMTADTGQLGQLVLNLLTNAAEAAGQGGWLDVSLKRQPGRDAGPEAVLEVVDSGPGPQASLAPRLFEPFVTDKPEGVGLGLAVARQAAEAHGARIEWHRSNGLTVFRVVLPVCDP